MAVELNELADLTLSTVAQALTGSSVHCESFLLYAPGGNAGTTTVGSSSVSAGASAIVISPGERQSMSVDIDGKLSVIDLANVYALGTSGDTLKISYLNRSN